MRPKSPADPQHAKTNNHPRSHRSQPCRGGGGGCGGCTPHGTAASGTKTCAFALNVSKGQASGTEPRRAPQEHHLVPSLRAAPSCPAARPSLKAENEACATFEVCHHHAASRVVTPKHSERTTTTTPKLSASALLFDTWPRAAWTLATVGCAEQPERPVSTSTASNFGHPQPLLSRLVHWLRQPR